MAKTKTFGVRLAPELINELERLKEAFSFTSYGEMIEVWVRLLQRIDEGVFRIKKHPREWNAQELERHLLCADKRSADYSSQVEDLTWRRLRARFGEDGVQHIRELIADLSSGVRRQDGQA